MAARVPSRVCTPTAGPHHHLYASHVWEGLLGPKQVWEKGHFTHSWGGHIELISIACYNSSLWDVGLGPGPKGLGGVMLIHMCESLQVLVRSRVVSAVVCRKVRVT